MDIKNLTLEQKIGQMMVAGFPSSAFDSAVESIIKEHSIGNIVLFSGNIGGKRELAKFNDDIQRCMLETLGIPAFISIDQEGGMVTRIQDEEASFFPGNMAFAAAGGDTFTEGRITGAELKALGINMNLAPVLDVNNNPMNPVIGVRSYSDDEKRVARYGTGYIKGIRKQGVVAVGKHFPGHGDTDTDSHLALPVVPYDMDRLERIELYPFREAIKNGLEAVMTAHVLFPAIEKNGLPATMSHAVLTGLLRKKLGFGGLILTDCMEMSAISSHFGTVNACIAAVNAGADLLCISHTARLQVECVKTLKDAVLSGVIPESRIDEAVGRILAVKRKYGLFENCRPDYGKVEGLVGCKEHLAFTEGVSRNSITLVKDAKGLIPVKPGNLLAISPEIAPTGADERFKHKNSFCEAVKEQLGGTSASIPLKPDNALIGELIRSAAGRDAVIIGTYNANIHKEQAELVSRIAAVNPNTIVVSLRNPYDILMFRDISSYICAYEYTRLSVGSAVEVLKGDRTASGSLPVKLDPVKP